MKYQIGDRVVHANNVCVGGTIVREGRQENKGNCGIFAYYVYDVLWDNKNKVYQDHMECYLYPESITNSANRQPKLEERIQRLEAAIEHLGLRDIIK